MGETIGYVLSHFIEAVTMYCYCRSTFRRPEKSYKLLISTILLYVFLYISFSQYTVVFNTLFFVIGNAVVIRFVCNTKLVTAIFHSFMLETLLILSELIAISMLADRTGDYYSYYSDVVVLLIEVAVSKLMYFALVLTLSYFIKGYKEKEKGSPKLVALLYGIPVMSITLISVASITIMKNPAFSKFGMGIAIGSITVLLMNLLVFYIYYYNQKLNQQFTESKLEAQREHLDAQYYKMMLQNSENQRILIHDIKNHLHVLQTLLQEDKIADAQQYLERLTGAQALKKSVTYCNNNILNIILVHYAALAEDKNISMEIDVRHGTLDFMESSDIAVLFGNLLDNAVASAENLESAYIELSVKKKENYQLITLINSCDIKPATMPDGELKTTKQDSGRHGYGTKSIKRIVEKYNGMVNFYHDENNKTFHSVIHIRTEEK